MFSVQNITEDGFDKVVLKDDTTGTYAEVVPSCACILHAFVVLKNGEKVNVIDSFVSADDFKKNVTGKGFLGCKLSPFVCRINKGKYHFAEKDYQIQKFYLGNNALHGELYDQSFTVTQCGADDQQASVSMKYDYRGSDPGYPFKYDCTVTYRLEKENKLSVITESANRDEGLIPIQDGWHPYFTLGDKIDDLQLEFQSKELVEFDSELIPTGKLTRFEEYGSLKLVSNTFLDNCYTLNFAECQPMCVLRNPLKKIEVEIHPEESYPYLQIYTPPHRNSIALENISSAPDAFNNGMGLKVLSPRETVTFKTAYKIKLLP
ncbi:MAG: aldose 1-epimerase [Chitinophagaceae bacterium]|nr:aldose 1-epimerase [Chitinophagaceae bacterium]